MDKKTCWMCGKEIDFEDKFCRHCGKGQSEGARFPYTIWGIVAQFLVIGPFCLISLWKSPVIDKNAKRITAYTIVGITTAIVILILYAINIIVNYYTKAFSM